MVRDLLSEVLSQAGYRAISFVDGGSVIAAARERIPACVILDIYMAGRSGLEILKDLDAPNYPAPIFVASGRGDIPSAVEAIKNGAFDFIEKRLDAATLVTRVAEAIAARAQENSNGAESLLPALARGGAAASRALSVPAGECRNSPGISSSQMTISSAYTDIIT